MITSLQNPLVKTIRQLHQAKHRQRQSQVLLEGTHLVTEALATQQTLIVVCHTQAWQEKNPQLSASLSSHAQRIELVSPEVLAALATTQTPDGIIATIDRPPPQAIHLQSLGLVLESIQDPGNLGTIIRTAAAANVEGIYLGPGCVDLEHPKILRATAGQWFRVPWQKSLNIPEVLSIYQNQNWQIVATSPSPHSLNFWDLDYRQPTLLLLGSEGQGLSSELLHQASHQVYIPQASGVESLNVAIATALLLYELKRQRRVKSGEA